MVFGVGTLKDITIYEVLYSEKPRKKPRKISFNIILSKAESPVRHSALNLTLAHKKIRFSFRRHVYFSLCLVNTCRNHLQNPFTRRHLVPFTRGCLVHAWRSFTSTRPVHKYMSRSHVEGPVTRRDHVHRLGIGCLWSSTCNLHLLV